MKKVFNTLGFFTFGLLTSCVAYAQDGLPPPIPVEAKELNAHPELNLNEDKTLIYDGMESRTISPNPSNSSSVSRDTQSSSSKISNTAKSKPGEVKQQDKEGADPLSFNFLYYLIQKFKISDMVD